MKLSKMSVKTRWMAGAGLVGLGYAFFAGLPWRRYGSVARRRLNANDELLDRFMPEFDVVDRRLAHVRAPAETALARAQAIELFDLPVVHAIIRMRELVLGGQPERSMPSNGLVSDALALGWVKLAEIPGRQIVFGAATRPWEANVKFRPVSPDVFAAFDEPNYVKIVWTLRADPVRPDQSLFITETRAAATDDNARRKFKRYWTIFSPGIRLIRRAAVRRVKAAVSSP